MLIPQRASTQPRTSAALAGIVLLGLALRLWSARGGLWVDEAWSAIMVERARTPLGIFTAINHDNNHHLNSLWMWLVGYGASPLAVRALSIATGTLAMVVAAAIGARRSRANALIAASLFAVSPMMVDYGSEARGYMPMLLALLTMIWLVLRWLETPAAPRPVWRLAVLATLGLLAQLTMLFGLCALGVWVAVTLRRDRSTGVALRETIQLFLPTLVATVVVIAIVLGAAMASPTGIQVGDYVAFSPALLWNAVRIMVAASLGGLAWPDWTIAAAMIAIVAVLVVALRRRDPMANFYFMGILGLPLVLALLQVGNTGMPRYFLLSSLALLLLVAGRLAAGFAQGRMARAASAVVLALLCTASVRDDLAQAALRRGDTGAAIEAMAMLAPNGAAILVEHLRPIATLQVAAAERGYPLRIVTSCPAARFLHIDLAEDAPAPRSVQRCRTVYQRLVVRRRGVLSGVDWALYARADPPEKRAETTR